MRWHVPERQGRMWEEDGSTNKTTRRSPCPLVLMYPLWWNISNTRRWTKSFWTNCRCASMGARESVTTKGVFGRCRPNLWLGFWSADTRLPPILVVFDNSGVKPREWNDNHPTPLSWLPL